MVISGKHKGKTAVIEKVDVDMVYLKGINVVKKATKWKGFIEKNLPLHISNVMYYSEQLKKPVKIEIVENNGKKVRKIKKSDIIITP